MSAAEYSPSPVSMMPMAAEAASSASTEASTSTSISVATAPSGQAPSRRRGRGGDALQFTVRHVLPPVLGMALLFGVWALLSMSRPDLPTPWATLQSAIELFKDPFYDKGPNDQGIGWNILHSLQRVGMGFGMAAVLGIPLGFMIGRFAFMQRMLAPIISLLRPVSPLAWLPIGLLVFKAANPASIWVIFISSIWPMIINTGVGVSQVPQDYLNVARVLKLSEWQIATKIMFPAVLPAMLTGIRLSIGVAWLVIVAAEMLTGGVGLGFWVWDEWNNLNVAHIIVAIFVVGLVGLLLEQSLVWLASRFSYGQD